MALVVDASALAEYLVGTTRGSAVADRLARDPNLHVPHLAIVEVASMLRGWVRVGLLDATRAKAALADLADFPATRWPSDVLLNRIWELRESLTAYDAVYVALAEALDAVLLTADARLVRALGGRGECEIDLVDE